MDWMNNELKGKTAASGTAHVLVPGNSMGGLSSMKRQGQCPETVCMATSSAICPETQMAGRGDFFFNGAKICPNFWTGGNAKGFGFESRANRIDERLFYRSGEGEAFYPISAVATGSVFRQLTTDPRLINTDAAKTGQLHVFVQNFCLFCKRGILRQVRPRVRKRP